NFIWVGAAKPKVRKKVAKFVVLESIALPRFRTPQPSTHTPLNCDQDALAAGVCSSVEACPIPQSAPAEEMTVSLTVWLVVPPVPIQVSVYEYTPGVLIVFSVSPPFE